MLPFINTTIKEPCIYIDGPLKGQEDIIYCLGPGSPCDFKIIRYKNTILRYHAQCKEKVWLKDEQDRYILKLNSRVEIL